MRCILQLLVILVCLAPQYCIIPEDSALLDRRSNVKLQNIYTVYYVKRSRFRWT